jgi:hypothetical protein
MEHLLSKVFEKNKLPPDEQVRFMDFLIGTSKSEDSAEHIKLWKEIKQQILDDIAEKALLGENNESVKS